MAMGGGGRGSLGSRDESAQRAANRGAPKVEGLLRRITALFRPYRLQVATIVVLVLLVAAIQVFPPLIIQDVFDRALFPETGGVDFRLLLQLLALMSGLAVTAAGLGVLQSWLTARVGNSVMGSLRTRLFEHLQRMELAFFTRTKTGVIQSRLQNDVGGVANVLKNTVSSVVGNSVTVIASFITMLILSWQLTLVAVVLMPVLVLAQRRVGQIRARIATRTQESLSDMTAITQEALSVSGVLLAKAFGRQGTESGRYADENRRQVRLQVQLAMSGQVFFAIVNVIISLLPAIIYLVAGFALTGGADGITAGTLVAFTTVQSRLLMPMMGLLRVALDLQTSGALFARIFEYLDLKPAITWPAAPRPIEERRLGEVEFERVTFRYADARDTEPPTLDDLSFRVEPGQLAAFVGPSGSGKTTIGYLVPRLYDATGGTVRFSGVDVRELAEEELTANIGVVSQEPYLFHATIADNLRYALPEATEADLEEACRAANILDTIRRFPDGFETVVGERGYRLSGGEKQRVAIARVLLKDPAVLVLDEATSALDTVSERIVQSALDEAARGRTTLAIAHRLSTIQRADVIFVVDAGRIVERGTHDELLGMGGRYTQLFTEQARL